MIGKQSTSNQTSSGNYQFTGAELAAIRLVELISNHPKVKEAFDLFSKNSSTLNSLVTSAAELIDESSKKEEFIQTFTKQKPLEELKNELIKFIAENFETHQIEYMINLATDLRLPDLLKRGVSVVETMSNKFFEELEKFSRAVESRPPGT
jgi:hypothetical protein